MEDDAPTVLDVYRGTKNIKGRQVSIEIHDTSGDDQLGFNRKTQYQGCDVFMICVAINNINSLNNVEKWRNEIIDSFKDSV